MGKSTVNGYFQYQTVSLPEGINLGIHVVYVPFYGGYIINNCWDSCGIFHLDILTIVE